jgi:hypothetical protein
MIEESTADSLEPLQLGSLEFSGETEATVNPAERYKRACHYPATVWLTRPAGARRHARTQAVRSRLFGPRPRRRP